MFAARGQRAGGKALLKKRSVGGGPTDKEVWARMATAQKVVADAARVVLVVEHVKAVARVVQAAAEINYKSTTVLSHPHEFRGVCTATLSTLHGCFKKREINKLLFPADPLYWYTVHNAGCTRGYTTERDSISAPVGESTQ